MLSYEFVEVRPKGGLRAGATDAYEECKKIISEKAKEGWDLVQILPVGNEKTGTFSLLYYSLIFKVEK